MENTKTNGTDWNATFERAKSLKKAMVDAKTPSELDAARNAYREFLIKEIDAKGVELVTEQFTGNPVGIVTMPTLLAGRLR